MIASENVASPAIMAATGSVFTNKYSEGYPGARYYAGQDNTDKVEEYAIELAKKLFNAPHANVQPHSGSQANQAVYFATLQPKDTILSMSLDAGGHLTHGAKPTLTAHVYNVVQYGLDPEGVLDYAQIETLAKQHKPKMIIVGGSAYPLVIDFARIRAMIDKLSFTPKPLLMVDMAHFAGLVAAGLYPNPMEWADVVTSTTHKTLRGPRGGLILCRAELAKAIDKAVFPGIQGGPLMHVIAAKAVCFEEALMPSFKIYMQKVVQNTAYLCQKLQEIGIKMVGNGTETHLFLVDLGASEKTGDEVSRILDEKFNIIVNKNKIFNDKRPATVTSGIRVGLAFITNNRRVDKNVLDEIRDVFAHVILDKPLPKIKLLPKVFK